MKKTLGRKFWFTLTVFSLMGQVAWVVENMYFNVFLYKIFNASAADISLMVSASAISAALTTLLMGALSDRVGKRKLFICGGYVAWGVSILAFSLIRMDVLTPLTGSVSAAAALGVTLVIVMDCVMTFFGSTANDAAFNAWLTDKGDENNRGRIEGINSMMPLVAILVVFGGFMAFDLDKTESWTAVFLIIGLSVVAIGILGFFLIDESCVKSEATRCYWKNVCYSFRPSVIRENHFLYLAVGAFAVFNISIQTFMPYLILYYEKSLGMANYVLILAPAIILAAAITAYYGRQYDRLGFRSAVLPTVYCLMAGYVLLFFGRSTLPVFAGSLLMMTGYLTGMAVFGAIVKDRIPADKAGLFQGLRIFGQVLIPGVIGPAIGAAVLHDAAVIVNGDGTTSFLPDTRIFAAAFAAALVLLAVLAGLFRMIRNGHYDLQSESGAALAQTLAEGKPAWDAYPRPQLRRDSFFCLNGVWQCNGRDIQVPFPPQAALSGYRGGVENRIVYEKHFTRPEGFDSGRVLLHFGAVDQIARVSLNGTEILRNDGGYLPFSGDVTAALRDGENVLTVCVTDALDRRYPYGKQRKKRGGMWYTPVSGIWQTVWMERLPAQNAVEGLRITPDLTGVTLEVQTIAPSYTVTVQTENGALRLESTQIALRIDLPDPHLWTPDDPYLYSFIVEAGEDRVESYFALRTVEIAPAGGKPRILLNGKPVFLHGVLDQGYFCDGLYLPAAPSEGEADILRMKKLGFNLLRKHLKIEPEAFYCACDRLGMLVLQDMVNSGHYSFVLDTALPTLGLKTRGDRRLPGSRRRRVFFQNHAAATQSHLYNHPCVVGYTVFNEGWGQFRSDEVTDLLRRADPTRFYDATSGWFCQKGSDVDSRHVYFKDEALSGNGEKPLLVTECGGFAWAAPGHIFSKYAHYSYGTYPSSAALTDAVEGMYRRMILPAVKDGLCGCVYTQLSDVEDEINGLYTYDRKVCKVDEARMAALSRDLYKAMEETV